MDFEVSQDPNRLLFPPLSSVFVTYYVYAHTHIYKIICVSIASIGCCPCLDVRQVLVVNNGRQVCVAVRRQAGVPFPCDQLVYERILVSLGMQ